MADRAVGGEDLRAICRVGLFAPPGFAGLLFDFASPACSPRCRCRAPTRAERAVEPEEPEVVAVGGAGERVAAWAPGRDDNVVVVRRRREDLLPVLDPDRLAFGRGLRDLLDLRELPLRDRVRDERRVARFAPGRLLPSRSFEALPVEK